MGHGEPGTGADAFRRPPTHRDLLGSPVLERLSVRLRQTISDFSNLNGMQKVKGFESS